MSEVEQIKFQVEGLAALIHHSRRLANWRDPITQELKLLTQRRRKTEEELEAISRLEFFGGLYTNRDGRPIVPAQNLEAAITKAASRQKLGKACKQGLRVNGDMLLEYDGPKTAEGLWDDTRFVFITQVVISGTTDRTRPIFDQWAGEFTVTYDPSILQANQVIKAVVDAGAYEGVGDWRPQHGRFKVVSHEAVK